MTHDDATHGVPGNVAHAGSNHEVLDRVREAQARLTRAEQRLAHLLLEQPETFVLSTVAAVAREAGVSDATVVRFGASLGYSGFTELKNALKHELFREWTVKQLTANPFERTADRSVFRQSFEADSALLAATTERIRDTDVDRAVNLLLGARTIQTVGMRTAASLAVFSAGALNSLLGNTRRIDGADGVVQDQVLRLTPDDVVLAFSFPRYTQLTHEVLRLAADRGIAIVYVTDHVLAPGTEYADVVLSAAVASRIPTLSYVGALAIVNGLLAEIVARAGDRVARSLEEWERFLERTTIFVAGAHVAGGQVGEVGR